MDRVDGEAKEETKSLDFANVALGPRPTPVGLLRAAVAMAFSVSCALALDWRWEDIAWGLWISSLGVGYACLIATLLLVDIPLRRRDGRGHNAVYVVFMAAVFSVHFGFIHVAISHTLHEHLPLDPDREGTWDAWYPIAEALRRYWPLMLASMYGRLGDLRGDRDRIGKGAAFLGPYLVVVRLILMSTAVAILHECGAGEKALYVVLAGAFFPWGPVLRLAFDPLDHARLRLLRWGEARGRRKDEEFRRQQEEYERRHREG